MATTPRTGEMKSGGSLPGRILRLPHLLLLAVWLGSGLSARSAPVAGKAVNWQPFQPVQRPAVPDPGPVDPRFNPANPIDRFLSARWAERGLTPRPEASRLVLLRRLYLDLIGLNPSPAEQQAFLDDTAPGAYERRVDQLLKDPRHGERWARHWMDIWRYSDWAGWSGGNQIRDSKPHIWRWRDWIVEALNADKPYDRMVMEMLAADEIAPDDPGALRATGFLVRNYKMLSRERWMEDTVTHTSQAFLGITMGCAQCHDHARDPITQREYFQIRAIFEPHQVRTDRLPGELDRSKAGLVRVYDLTNAVTWVLDRGDERHPLTNEVIEPGVPAALGGHYAVEPVALPRSASHPDEREFVWRDLVAAGEAKVTKARNALEEVGKKADEAAGRIEELKLSLEVEEKQHAALLAVWQAEQSSGSSSPSLKAVHQQRIAAVAAARLRVHRAAAALEAAGAEGEKKPDALKKARKEAGDAEKNLAEATTALEQPLDERYAKPAGETYPPVSTGRRLAFARWLTGPENPLTARVAANHLWLRHFGRGLVATPANFGSEGSRPTHPELLDWLAAELMQPSAAGGGSSAPAWSMRHLHRLICTSAAYRMASTPDEANLAIDPDNLLLWRMNFRRIEAESVRDNLLNGGGLLDLTQGGPEIPHQQALTSHRRSLYLQQAAEKQAEFLQIFDGPSVNECYQRHASVMPQQALALSNSELALRVARSLAGRLTSECGGDQSRFVTSAYQHLLARPPNGEELAHCLGFLQSSGPPPGSDPKDATGRSRENLVLVLINHNDFVTVR